MSSIRLKWVSELEISVEYGLLTGSHGPIQYKLGCEEFLECRYWQTVGGDRKVWFVRGKKIVVDVKRPSPPLGGRRTERARVGIWRSDNNGQHLV